MTRSALILIALMLAASCVGYTADAASTDDPVSGDKETSSSPKTTTTVRRVVVQSGGLGEELLPQVVEAATLVAQGNLAEAEPLLDQLVGEYTKRMTNQRRTYISVSTDMQLKDYIRTHPESEVERVSVGLQSVLFLRAFMAVERQQWALALQRLRQLLQYAPYCSGAYIENGAILLQQDKYPEALASYTSALKLAELYQGERHNIPVALRGLGVAYVKLERMSEAREVLLRAERYQPQHSLSTGYLKMIAALTAEASPVVPPPTTPEKAGHDSGSE